jgi:hypothetical protein
MQTGRLANKEDEVGSSINFNHVLIAKNTAEMLCYKGDLRAAMNVLDQAVCMMQLLANSLDPYIEQRTKDAIRHSMADVLDDMSCIQHTQKKYEAAIYFLQLRMNMLLGIEDNDTQVEVSCNGCALSDAHSGMFVALRLHAKEQEKLGKLECAIETSLLALNMLEHCHEYADNHVHICDTMLHVARMYDTLGKFRKAKDFELRSGAVQNKGATATCLYQRDEKIFVRPLHGESPVLRCKAYRVKVLDLESPEKLVDEMADFSKFMSDNGLSILQEERTYKSMQIAGPRRQGERKPMSTNQIYTNKAKEHQAEAMMRQLLLEEEAQLAAPKKASRKQRRAESKKKHEALQALSESGGGGVRDAGAACGPAEASNESDALSHFHCPLTLEVMRNPVVTVDGHSFEESAIRLWLQDHDTSPMTNQVLASKVLIPNITLKVAIQAAGLLVVDRI